MGVARSGRRIVLIVALLACGAAPSANADGDAPSARDAPSANANAAAPANADGNAEVEWKELGADVFKADGDMMRWSNTVGELSRDANTLRVSFHPGELFPGKTAWDPAAKLAPNMYEDLASMTMMQVSVSASVCDQNTDVCARYFGNKSVFLGVESPALLPSDYSSQHSSNKDVVIHTSWCAHPPTASRWHLAVSSDLEELAKFSKVLVHLRIELVPAHAVGATNVAFSSASSALIGVPVENSGAGDEDLRVAISAQRSVEWSGNAEMGAQAYLHLLPLGFTAGECPTGLAGRKRAALESSLLSGEVSSSRDDTTTLMVEESITLSIGEKRVYFALLVFVPPGRDSLFVPPGRDSLTDERRLVAEVDAWLDGPSTAFHNCTGACERRSARYDSLSQQASKLPLPEAIPLYQVMRLLFPRRAFPALRFGDMADLSGMNQMKWHRYARAVRVVGVEIGDTYAMSALHASEPHVKATSVLQAVAQMQYASAEQRLALARDAVERNDLRAAEAHVRRVVALRGSVKDIDELAYIRMLLRNFSEAEELYRLLAEMQPGPMVHFALAGALHGKGDLAGAIAEMREGLRLSPDDAQMQARLELWLQHSGAPAGLPETV
ncbi:hypothetical protein T484DRAFT_1930681 [Baffinella frigidus]|nr:hypothetical protein T484DRAFT_1930681 [Cryptophyta sp. CCMP2293]